MISVFHISDTQGAVGYSWPRAQCPRAVYDWGRLTPTPVTRVCVSTVFPGDDDVYYNICQRLKLEGETENMVVCTKERKGEIAEVLMATPCTNSLGGESGGQQHEKISKKRVVSRCACRNSRRSISRD